MAETRRRPHIRWIGRKFDCPENQLRFMRTIKFLSRKGFVYTATEPDLAFQGLVGLADLLWVGECVEPVVLEMIAMVVARFPNRFENAPQDLMAVIRLLQSGAQTGPAFRGCAYQNLKYWFDAESGKSG